MKTAEKTTFINLSGTPIVWESFYLSLFTTLFQKILVTLDFRFKKKTISTDTETTQETFSVHVKDVEAFKSQLEITEDNIVINLYCNDRNGGHAELLLVDYYQQEVYRWDPNGETPSYDQNFIEMMDNMLYELCAEMGYEYIVRFQCFAPQYQEFECRYSIRGKQDGFCASYSLVFGLLYMYSKLDYATLSKKLELAFDKDQCIFHETFQVLSDCCARWLLQGYPQLAKKLSFVKNVDNHAKLIDIARLLPHVLQIGAVGVKDMKIIQSQLIRLNKLTI